MMNFRMLFELLKLQKKLLRNDRESKSIDNLNFNLCKINLLVGGRIINYRACLSVPFFSASASTLIMVVKHFCVSERFIGSAIPRCRSCSATLSSDESRATLSYIWTLSERVVGPPNTRFCRVSSLRATLYTNLSRLSILVLSLPCWKAV